MAFEIKRGKGRKSYWIRYHYLINPKLQLPIVIYFLLFPALANVFLYWKIKSLVGLIYQEFQHLPGGAGMKISATEMLLSGDVAQLNGLFIFYGLLMAVFLFVGGVLLTHRIAGPAYKIKMYLSDLAMGKNPEKLNLRRNDFLHDVAEAINKTLENK